MHQVEAAGLAVAEADARGLDLKPKIYGVSLYR
jgi:hypothetical protein